MTSSHGNQHMLQMKPTLHNVVHRIFRNVTYYAYVQCITGPRRRTNHPFHQRDILSLFPSLLRVLLFKVTVIAPRFWNSQRVRTYCRFVYWNFIKLNICMHTEERLAHKKRIMRIGCMGELLIMMNNGY